MATTNLKKHEKGYNLVNFADVEVKSGVAESQTDSQYIFQVIVQDLCLKL